jgi:hypothetical protein
MTDIQALLSSKVPAKGRVHKLKKGHQVLVTNGSQWAISTVSSILFDGNLKVILTGIVEATENESDWKIGRKIEVTPDCVYFLSTLEYARSLAQKWKAEDVDMSSVEFKKSPAYVYFYMLYHNHASEESAVAAAITAGAAA